MSGTRQVQQRADVAWLSPVQLHREYYAAGTQTLRARDLQRHGMADKLNKYLILTLCDIADGQRRRARVQASVSASGPSAFRPPAAVYTFSCAMDERRTNGM